MKRNVNPFQQTAAALSSGYDGGAGAVREAHGRNVNDIMGGGGNIWGADTPAYARDKMQTSQLFRNNLEMSRGLADARQKAITFQTDTNMQLGRDTEDTLVQEGSSGTSQGTSSGTSSGSQTGSPLDTASKIIGIAS